jgi:uncharacterized membrane protein YoaK (UPF0700 family)
MTSQGPAVACRARDGCVDPRGAAWPAVLSGVAGYVDTAGFLALFGLFPAHVTGELVTAGAALTGPHRLAPRLLMIPVFMSSVATTALIARAARRRGASSLTPVLGLLTLALALFCLGGVLLRPHATDADGWASLLVGGAGVWAMGIQNTLMRDALGGLTPTTIMTGNLTQTTIDLVELSFQRCARARADTVRRLCRFGVPLLAFLLGAAIGGCLTRLYGLASIALPAAVVGALTLRAHEPVAVRWWVGVGHR